MRVIRSLFFAHQYPNHYRLHKPPVTAKVSSSPAFTVLGSNLKSSNFSTSCLRRARSPSLQWSCHRSGRITHKPDFYPVTGLDSWAAIVWNHEWRIRGGNCCWCNRNLSFEFFESKFPRRPQLVYRLIPTSSRPREASALCSRDRQCHIRCQMHQFIYSP